MSNQEPALYGLTDSNTNRSGEKLWGKNQFNSAFPLALCLKMRDDGVQPIYVTLGSGNEFLCSGEELDMASVVGREEVSPFYEFEASFPPYEQYVKGSIKKIDLVVKAGSDSMPIRPLEVKLTVVPDSTTVGRQSSDWAPELVVRPVSSAYAMLSVAHRLFHDSDQELRQRVEAALQPINSSISASAWDNVTEIASLRTRLAEDFSNALDLLRAIQEPYLVQPIWRTQGASFKFQEHCFDVFIWSDVSILAVPLNRVLEEAAKGNHNQVVSRALREVARHVRALYDLCTRGYFRYHDCYGGMALGHQTSKSFSIPGYQSRKHLDHPRLQRPHYSKNILKELILHGGENMLKPERRLDMAVSVDALVGVLEN